MFTVTSQDFSATKLKSSKKASKNNLLSILFFFMGTPHIYSAMQRGSSQGKSLEIESRYRSHSEPTSNVSRFSLSRYLSILILGLFTAGVMEMLRAIAK